MLDENLLHERLAQFKPEPLVDYDLEAETEILEIPVVKENQENIDLAKTNFLNMLDNDEIKTTAEECIRKYSVGTCGPRAFYGTTDVHLNLEEGLAKFLGTEESIVYSYGFVAISSSIAAYCNKKDTVFIDENANFPTLQGLQACKSKVVTFKHNDYQNLLEILEDVSKNEKKPTRKFLIIEGISWKTGKLCPVPEFIKIAEKFKMRIFLDETYSLAVFGKTGRGLTEHFNIPVEKIDMIFGTIEGAIGSIGGFCAGSKILIEHQRLSGAGYIFSASLTTYLAQIVLKSLELLKDKPQKLTEFSSEFHNFLVETCNFNVLSNPMSPFKVFTHKDIKNHPEYNSAILEYCKKNQIYFIQKENGLVINLNVALKDNQEKLDKVYRVLKEASQNL